MALSVKDVYLAAYNLLQAGGWAACLATLIQALSQGKDAAYAYESAGIYASEWGTQ